MAIRQLKQSISTELLDHRSWILWFWFTAVLLQYYTASTLWNSMSYYTGVKMAPWTHATSMITEKYIAWHPVSCDGRVQCCQGLSNLVGKLLHEEIRLWLSWISSHHWFHTHGPSRECAVGHTLVSVSLSMAAESVSLQWSSMWYLRSSLVTQCSCSSTMQSRRQ